MRVIIDRLYDILIQARYLKRRFKDRLVDDKNFCKFYEEIRYNLDDYEEFNRQVVKILTFGILRIKSKDINNEVGMIKVKKIKVYRLQYTESGLPKLVLTRLLYTYKENYSAMPHN